MTTTSETGSSTRDAASTAADEGRHVGQTAGEEASNVANEAAGQVRNLAGEARSQVEEQSRNQRDRLVSTLSTFSDDLDSMSGQGTEGQGLAADAARMVADRARQLSSHLEGREPSDLLGDVRAFARRRPGTFLLGSLAAGVVAGRLLRGAKDAGGSSTSDDRGPGYASGPDHGAVTRTTFDVSAVAPTSSGGVGGIGGIGDLGDVEHRSYQETP